jgi:hypothetical protein
MTSLSWEERFDERYAESAMDLHYKGDRENIKDFFRNEIATRDEELIARLTEIAKTKSNLMDIEEGKVDALYLHDALSAIRGGKQDN